MVETWNRCDDCGQFIPYRDFADGRALRRLLEPDSDLGVEKWETLCGLHYAQQVRSSPTTVSGNT